MRMATVMRNVDYDRLSSSYDARYAAHEYRGVEDTLADLFPSDCVVLDVGCGTGRWLRFLRSRGARAIGVDLSEGMLRRAAEHGSHSLACGSALDLPFASNSFDAVLVVNALHHFREPAEFVREAARVLKPEGRFVTIGLDPSLEGDTWYVYQYFDGTEERDRRRYPPTSNLRALLEDASFHTVVTVPAQVWNQTVAATAHLDAGLAAKEVCSQFALLTDAEYEQGIAAIRAAAADAERRGEELELAGRLTLYSTSGILARDGEASGAPLQR